MKEVLVMPDFYGIFKINSCTKNRIRMTVDKLKNNNEIARELKSNLDRIEGIKSSKILTSIGSVTVEFDSTKIESQFMIGIILNLLNLEDEIFRKRTGKIKYLLNNIIHYSDILIYNKTQGLLDTKTTIGILLLGYGIKKIKTNPIMPAGATLIWWAFNLLKKDIDKEGL